MKKFFKSFATVLFYAMVFVLLTIAWNFRHLVNMEALEHGNVLTLSKDTVKIQWYKAFKKDTTLTYYRK